MKTELCHTGRIMETSKPAGKQNRCPEPAVLDRMYCQRHLEEAMARVAMVSPPDWMPRRWGGRGLARGSMLNTNRRAVVSAA